MTDTIVATSTASGRGGIAIIRISGPQASIIAKQYCANIVPRYAHYVTITDQNSQVIDKGLMLLFLAPNSYTGEDVVEFQGHGNPVIVNQLLNHFISLGCRLAEPGEFTKRAYLNNKMDLVQAQSVMATINAQSEHCARAAMRNLQGDFSKQVANLNQDILTLRMYIEAEIDFSDQEISLNSKEQQQAQLQNILNNIDSILARSIAGNKLSQQTTIALVGPPNVGKSSLFNLLAQKDAAIVSTIAGTTRDILEQSIVIQNIPCVLFDTAGIHTSSSQIEKIGIDKALSVINNADIIMLMADASIHDLSFMQQFWKDYVKVAMPEERLILVWNKIDLIKDFSHEGVGISIKENLGIEGLQQAILKILNISNEEMVDMIPATTRHLSALKQAKGFLLIAQAEINLLELVAENLKLAHDCLASIAGDSQIDAVLTEIFSKFCIGK